MMPGSNQDWKRKLIFWKRNLVFWAGAIVVGISASLFAIASEYANKAFGLLVAESAYLPLIITPLGLVLVAILTKRYFPGSQGSGIPQTIAALSLPSHSARDQLLSLRIAFGKILLTLLGLFSGASIGREGPTVQIGASIMHSLGKLAHFPRHDLEKGLVLAGGAAGVAAAFNTPLAGIVFAIEEMSRSFEHRTSGTILISVVLAGVTAQALLGNYTYFGHTSADIGLNWQWSAVVICGIAGGLLGGGFSRMLIMSSENLPGKLQAFKQKYPVRFVALCGFVLALVGLASGGTIYGTGYHEVNQLLEGKQPLPESFGILKMVATFVSYLSGIPGGVFAPSLATGAGLGANLAPLMPYVPAGAVIVLGMVAYFSGVVQAPITAFVIVMEMTENHDIVLPLMATSFIAFTVSKIVCPKPLYQALAQGFLQRLENSTQKNNPAPEPEPGSTRN
ncbi:MAG: chloride channel protein [Sulfurimicrobium sp.]|nr:chloride channel protein [Sulfurimicrobium sp.]MDZ7655682.1 chloride channel protein [Sulfurimicrobium sp.]